MNLNDFLLAVVIFVVVAVSVSIGAYILGAMQLQLGVVTNTCQGSNVISQTTGLCINPVNALNVPKTLYSSSYNASGSAVSGQLTFAQWLPILAIVVVAVVIIALLYGFLANGGRGRSEAGVA